MKDFYTAFYAGIPHSPVHHEFCERAFGRDLGQHGFTDLKQLDLLIQTTQLNPTHHVLDLGCGNGMIDEYLSDCTGARFTGMDYIPQAIENAKNRTTDKADRLTFFTGDMNDLDLKNNSFDVILSIDTMYFCNDYTITLASLKAALRPGGQMAIFFSHGREPGVPAEQFDKGTLPADKTPLAEAFKLNGLCFQAWDLTELDYELAKYRKEILQELKAQFEIENLQFIYNNRLGEAEGIRQAIEDGLHKRYFYHVQFAED